jgi:cephalosporin hydroxylase
VTTIPLTNAFHNEYYNHRESWHTSRWMGLPIQQCPFDLMNYQQLIAQERPKLIVQAGVNCGGSILFFAHMLDILGLDARVIGIDVREPPAEFYQVLKAHPRISFIHGSSIDPSIVNSVLKASSEVGYHTLVSLDSDHSMEHVRAELSAYREVVKPGNFLVVEDTNLNGHPVNPGTGAGPWEALRDFLASGADFSEVDYADRHLFSFHSWLRRNV